MNKTYMQLKGFKLTSCFLENTLSDGSKVRIVGIDSPTSPPLKDDRFFSVMVVGKDNQPLNSFLCVSIYELDSIMDLLENGDL